MRISDWSSDVCSSDLSALLTAGGLGLYAAAPGNGADRQAEARHKGLVRGECRWSRQPSRRGTGARAPEARSGHAGQQPRAGRCRSEEHTSELQSLMRISYAVFCLQKKKKQETRNTK